MRRIKLERSRKSLRRFALVEYHFNGQRWSVRTSGVVRLPEVRPPAKLHAAVPAAPDRGDAATAAHQRPAHAAGAGGPSLSPAARAAPKVVISYIHYLGATKRTQADEFAELYNSGDQSVALAGWRLEAGAPGQAFTFPPGTVLAAEQRVQIFTDREPSEPGSFSFRSKRALWNDEGDLGRLLDASGVEISRYGYGQKETRSIATITSAHGVAGLQVISSPQHLAEQHSYRGKIDFLTAVERAIRCLLEEPRLGAQAARRRAVLQTERLRLLDAEDLPAADHDRLRRDWLFRLELGEPTGSKALTVVVARSGIKPAAVEPSS